MFVGGFSTKFCHNSNWGLSMDSGFQSDQIDSASFRDDMKSISIIANLSAHLIRFSEASQQLFGSDSDLFAWLE